MPKLSSSVSLRVLVLSHTKIRFGKIHLSDKVFRSFTGTEYFDLIYSCLFIYLVVHKMFCLFVLGFYGPVNNKVMSSRSVNSGTVPGQA